MRERGQLILVTGLAIAVSIVVLVVLLNTAIYTQNLATRSVDTGAQEALDYREDAAEGVAGLVAAENGRAYADRAALYRNVTAGTETLLAELHGRAVVDSVHAAAPERTFHNGTRIVQENGSRALTNASGASNWTLATGAAGVRGFEIDVAGDGLSGAGAATNATTVNVTGAGGDSWLLFVYDDSAATTDHQIAVQNGTETVPTDICNGSANGPTIDLTASTVDGADCAGLSFAEGVSAPYDVRYEYGANAEGSYELTVNTTAVSTGGLDGPGPAASPYWVPVVYDATLDVVYHATDLRYEGTVRVVPGERGA